MSWSRKNFDKKKLERRERFVKSREGDKKIRKDTKYEMVKNLDRLPAVELLQVN